MGKAFEELQIKDDFMFSVIMRIIRRNMSRVLSMRKWKQQGV